MNIVITGASEGIGKAVAEIFALRAHTKNLNTVNLHLSARNKNKLLTLKEEFANQYACATTYIFPVDLSQKENINALSKDILIHFNQIHVLVNNVGQYVSGQIIEENESILSEMININLYSAYYLTKNLLPIMLQQKNIAYIFNICSVASLQPYKNGGSYSISKYALLGFSENLREELKQTNIKVTSVCPGATMSNSWTNVDKDRIMEASDIAKSIFNATQLSPQAVVEKIVLRPQKGDL